MSSCRDNHLFETSKFPETCSNINLCSVQKNHVSVQLFYALLDINIFWFSLSTVSVNLIEYEQGCNSVYGDTMKQHLCDEA